MKKLALFFLFIPFFLATIYSQFIIEPSVQPDLIAAIYSTGPSWRGIEVHNLATYQGTSAEVFCESHLFPTPNSVYLQIRINNTLTPANTFFIPDANAPDVVMANDGNDVVIVYNQAGTSNIFMEIYTLNPGTNTYSNCMGPILIDNTYSLFSLDRIRMDINSDNVGVIVWNDNISGNILGKGFSIGGICSALSLGCTFNFGINNHVGFDVAMHENGTVTLAYTNNNYVNVHTESYDWNDIFNCLTPLIRPRPSQTITSSSGNNWNSQPRIAAPHISATTNYLNNPITIVDENNYALVFSDIEIEGHFWDHNIGSMVNTVINQPLIGCSWNENPDVVYTNDYNTTEPVISVVWSAETICPWALPPSVLSNNILTCDLDANNFTLLNVNGAAPGTTYKAVVQGPGLTGDFGYQNPVIASSIKPMLNMPSDAVILYGEDGGSGGTYPPITLYTKSRDFFNPSFRKISKNKHELESEILVNFNHNLSINKISLSSTSKKSSVIKILNMNGKLIKEFIKIPNENFQWEIPSDLSSGLYLLQNSNIDKTESFKFVIH